MRMSTSTSTCASVSVSVSVCGWGGVVVAFAFAFAFAFACVCVLNIRILVLISSYCVLPVLSYNQVPQYKERFRPKNHFATHYAADILRFGPPRRYWCFGYEAKNQEVKRAAASSNFKDVCCTAANILTYQAAQSLRKRKRGVVLLEAR